MKEFENLIKLVQDFTHRFEGNTTTVDDITTGSFKDGLTSVSYEYGPNHFSVYSVTEDTHEDYDKINKEIEAFKKLVDELPDEIYIDSLNLFEEEYDTKVLDDAINNCEPKALEYIETFKDCIRDAVNQQIVDLKDILNKL